MNRPSPPADPASAPSPASGGPDPFARRVIGELARRGVASLHDLAAAVGRSPGRVAEAMKDAVAAGRVERLRPVGYDGNVFDFYRLRRPGDGRLAWQRTPCRGPGFDTRSLAS